jgi:hypothetical protein
MRKAMAKIERDGFRGSLERMRTELWADGGKREALAIHEEAADSDWAMRGWGDIPTGCPKCETPWPAWMQRHSEAPGSSPVGLLGIACQEAAKRALEFVAVRVSE